MEITMPVARRRHPSPARPGSGVRVHTDCHSTATAHRDCDRHRDVAALPLSVNLCSRFVSGSRCEFSQFSLPKSGSQTVKHNRASEAVAAFAQATTGLFLQKLSEPLLNLNPSHKSCTPPPLLAPSFPPYISPSIPPSPTPSLLPSPSVPPALSGFPSSSPPLPPSLSLLRSSVPPCLSPSPFLRLLESRPPSLAPSLPRSRACSLSSSPPRFLASSLPRSLASLPRSLAPSLAPSLPRSLASRSLPLDLALSFPYSLPPLY